MFSRVITVPLQQPLPDQVPSASHDLKKGKLTVNGKEGNREEREEEGREEGREIKLGRALSGEVN